MGAEHLLPPVSQPTDVYPGNQLPVLDNNIEIMKKLITIIATAGILATSCSDFLTEIPKDEIAPSQFFKNSDHAYNAVNALYRSGLPSLFSGGVSSGSRIMFGAYTSGFLCNES